MQKISQFMSEALFDKNTGYYQTKNPLGKNADFITAPEISQVFGELLAAYILQATSNIKGAIALVEMGAGKGTLFYDILVTIDKLAKKKNALALDFMGRVTFHIIEINEVLRKIQREKLSALAISWYENFEEFLSKLVPQQKIFFIANELFDCFPIDQYVKTDIGWCERMVADKKFVLANFDPKIHNFIDNLAPQGSPFGGVFEYSATARNFMAQLGQALKNQGEMAIIIDYGYIKNEFANTLQAVKNHQKSNVLENIGESDITALVDFLALEKIAQNFNLNSSLISQREFLIGLGIEERRAILLQKKAQNEQIEINLGIDRLIDADKMGELFKCLILWK